MAGALAALILLAGCGSPREADRRLIAERYRAWHKALDEDRYADAYALMTPAYRAARTLDLFEDDYRFYADPSFRLRHGHELIGNGHEATLVPMDDVLHGSQTEFGWQKVDGTWYLTGEVESYVETPLGRGQQ